MKRSQAVSLVILAGAGTAAVVLADLDPSQDEEDVLVYPSAEACIAAALRLDSECRGEYDAARAAYPGAAPHYPTRAACEAHHGTAHCVAGESVAESARGQFLPRMAGYVIGRTAAQALAPQPVFEHAPQDGTAAASGGYGGYCTGSGGRIWTANGGRSTRARVASSAVRPAAFGGFGATGRSFGAHASAGSGGG